MDLGTPAKSSLVQQAFARREILLELDVQPWNHRRWLDRYEKRDFETIQGTLELDFRPVVATSRFLSLVEFAEPELLDFVIPYERERWTEFEKSLAGKLDLTWQEVRELSLHELQQRFDVDHGTLRCLWLAADLTATARYHHLIEDAEEGWTSRLDRWYDRDVLFGVTSDPDAEEDIRRKAEAILTLFKTFDKYK